MAAEGVRQIAVFDFVVSGQAGVDMTPGVVLVSGKVAGGPQAMAGFERQMRIPDAISFTAVLCLKALSAPSMPVDGPKLISNWLGPYSML